MKKLAVMLLILMVFLSVNSFAQSKRNKHFIKINEKGEILDSLGTRLGYIDKDNIVRNNKQENLYFIDKLGNVYDNTGKPLGKASNNGFFKSEDGKVSLEVRCIPADNCEIYDQTGRKLGNVHENYKLHACAAKCYFIKRKRGEREDI